MKALSRNLALVLTVVVLFLPAAAAFGGLITDPSDSALVGATVIDFNDQTNGTYNPPMTIHNVEFNAIYGWYDFVNLTFTDPLIFICGGGDKSIRSDAYSFKVTFPSPVTAFGFTNGNFDYFFVVLDSNGNNIEEFDYSGVSGPAFLGFSGENIGGFSLGFPNIPTEATAIYSNYLDNLYYVSAAPPVPTANLAPILLLLLGD